MSKVYEYAYEGPWEPTPRLRFRGEYSGDYLLRILQQKWERVVAWQGEAIPETQEEWRDVEFDDEA